MERDGRMVAAMVAIGIVLVAVVVSATIIAIYTDRELWRTGLLIFAGLVLIGSLGGVSWWANRRSGRWHITSEESDDES